MPEPRVRRVDIEPFAILGNHFPALKIRFARVVTRHQRFEVRIPIAQKVGAALLHPALEVALGDLVWKVETRMTRLEDRHLRQLVGHPERPCFRFRIRGEIAADELCLRICQYNQLVSRVLEQPRIVLRELGT